MKQICICILVSLLSFAAIGQYRSDSVCKRQTINVNAFVKGYPYQNKIYISKDSLLNGFSLDLSDNSYKIIGFKIFYEFPGDPFGESVIIGNKITTQNLSFIPNLKELGNGYFELFCIAIEKNGKKYNARDFVIVLADK